MITATFLMVLAVVETGGGVPNKIGPHGERGKLQITPVCIYDVNRIYGTTFTLDDAWDDEKSEQICRLYLSHYASRKRIGREVTDLDRARIWNGGPNGWRKPITTPYGEKFSLAWKAMTAEAQTTTTTKEAQ